ncbi:MAG: glycoside hydrolase family 99-like domain-containing protein [Verrucomicrobiota bacterium]|nr:glycoside hydrolase family 99-like domain-containing protein [Verrucomicrobiota bacterium]
MIETAVYYFPNYHADARNEKLHGEGWAEWDLVKRAEPRFPLHDQPKVPVWGYEDEADPQVMARKIDAAADHGIDTFIFDWYWYNDGPYLQRALDEGFLNAPNNDRLKFSLMWANHDWIDIHPGKICDGNPYDSATILYPGAVTPSAFEALIEQCVGNYFKHPSYWLMDGCPYFSVYELTKLMAGFGSVQKTRECLDRFRAAVKAAGFPDLHLNAIVWNNPILPGEQTPADPYRLIQDLGFDSVTSYVWVHHATLPDFPFNDFQKIEADYFQYWEKAQAECPVPYYPNLTMGWDPSPRTVQSDRYLPRGYPFTPLIDTTPELFRQSAERIKARMEELNLPNAFVTINAWNEWTEGSYLEPDAKNGMAYLEAIRDTFSVGKRVAVREKAMA